MAIIVAKKIKKSFTNPIPLHILKEIDLEIEAGVSLAIVGRSGEGKSTLLHILGTLEDPTSGEIWIAGERVTKGNSAALRNRHIGFIFQAFHLFDDSTALENVLLPLWIGGQAIGKGSPGRKRAEMLLERVGLAKRANFPAKLLSGGEKQRVAIARALIADPEILLADEPTGNLDRTNASLTTNLLLTLAKEEKKALVVATHSETLAHLSDRRVELQDGILKEMI